MVENPFALRPNAVRFWIVVNYGLLIEHLLSPVSDDSIEASVALAA